MHSRIFQLEKKPDFDPATEEDLQDLVDSGIADYVVEMRGDEARNDALNWFTGHFGGMTVGEDDEGRTVVRIASRFDPLARKLEEFKDKITGLDIEKFCDYFWAFQVRDLLGDRHGFYCYSNYGGYWTADSFFRHLEGSSIVLYVGTIFDYHS